MQHNRQDADQLAQDRRWLAWVPGCKPGAVGGGAQCRERFREECVCGVGGYGGGGRVGEDVGLDCGGLVGVYFWVGEGTYWYQVAWMIRAG